MTKICFDQDICYEQKFSVTFSYSVPMKFGKFTKQYE